jgi:HEPN domain-containing protein
MKPITNEWIEKAEGDFKVALREQKAPEPVYDAICFHAQQGVEKYLKAWLIEHGFDFPKTHDLEALAKLCLTYLPELQSLMDDLRFLISFAVEIRYPGILASEVDAEHCLHIALRGRDILRRQFGLGEEA